MHYGWGHLGPSIFIVGANIPLWLNPSFSNGAIFALALVLALLFQFWGASHISKNTFFLLRVPSFPVPSFPVPSFPVPRSPFPVP